jgi:hypothetical protein
MRVASKIVENMLGSAEGRLGVDIIIVLAATSAPSYGCGTPLAVTGICQSGPKPVSIHGY